MTRTLTLTPDEWAAVQAGGWLVMPGDCPHRRLPCGGAVRTCSWEQPALMYHGGYGESTRVTIRACRACDWQLCAETGAVRP